MQIEAYVLRQLRREIGREAGTEQAPATPRHRLLEGLARAQSAAVPLVHLHDLLVSPAARFLPG